MAHKVSGMMRTSSAVLALVILAHFCALVLAAPEYQFPFGRITGVDELAQDSQRAYYAYYGIPFAEPPVGSLRFRAPRPFANTVNQNRIISSNSFKAACVQVMIGPVETSEDCLHLNVFTPTTVNDGTGQLKKVMVYIHGGGYMFGKAADYPPSGLVADYDVIVVSVQYRLGVFGFLNPGGDKETNFGLRDQIMAIQWVKDNIRQFGGDGNDITIFGESAGATSVSLLSLSPLCKGLFSRVIMQSGVALSQVAVDEKSGERFIGVASSVGCASGFLQLPFVRDVYKDYILDCLRSKSVGDFFQPFSFGQAGRSAPQEFDVAEAFYQLITSDSGVGPTIDGIVIPKSPEILLQDRNYMQSNGVFDRSYMAGFNNAEGLLSLTVYPVFPGSRAPLDYELFQDPKVADRYVEAFTKEVFPQPVTDDVIDFVKYEYTYPRGDQGKPGVMNVLSVTDDVKYVVPTVQLARAITTLSPTTPFYLYLFDHYPELVNPDGPLKGSTHGLELSYQFDSSPFVNALFYARINTPSDRPLYNIVKNTWTQFAKTGRPSSPEYSSWPRFDPRDEFYLAISTTPEVRQRVRAKTVDLWTQVLPKRAGQSFRSRRFKLY